MMTKRLVVFLALSLLAGTPAVSGQTLFARGGAFSSDAPEGRPLSGSSPAAQLGARLDVTDLLALQGAFTYQNASAIEASVVVRPFGSDNRLQPYAFLGFGQYLSDVDERSVVPLGVGVEYEVLPGVNIDAAVAARSSVHFGQDDYYDVTPGVMPTLGVSYSLDRLFGGRPDAPGPLPIAEADVPEDEEADDPFKWGEGNPAQGDPDAVSGDGPGSRGDRTGTDGGVSGDGPGSRGDRAETDGGVSGDGPGARGDRAETDGGVSGDTPGSRGNRSGDAATGVSGDAQTASGVRGRDNPDGVSASTPGGSGATTRRAPRTMAGGAAGDRQVVIGEEMSKLPDGTFIMGLTDEDPLSLQLTGRRRVTISTFYIDRYEVTNEEYRQFMDAQGGEAMAPDSSAWGDAGNRINWRKYFYGSAYNDHPVVAVTQEQAVAYCEFQNKRLPTEAEWEYAARANQVGGLYPWSGFEPRDQGGNYLANYDPGRAGYAADGYAFTAPVDAFPSNPWGLYNVSGNAAEWVQDAYTDSYSDLSDFNPMYEDSDEERRIVRGGSWASAAFYIGVGVRDTQAKDEASPYVGFRCARDVGDEEDSVSSDSTETAPSDQMNGDADNR